MLVKPVEEFATVDQWTRGYDEIVEFERSLVMEGMILLKFWMHISDEEQLRTSSGGAAEPLKTWKLTDEDWRNREKRPPTSRRSRTCWSGPTTRWPPWLLVEGESKRYARVRVVETAIAEIERGMRERGFESAGPPAAAPGQDQDQGQGQAARPGGRRRRLSRQRPRAARRSRPPYLDRPGRCARGTSPGALREPYY